MFAALREVLGSHVVQRGSRQDDASTRFDISHTKAVSAEELAHVERKVNGWIWDNQPVVTKILGKHEAVASGATAQFGEKYGDEVRVVHMGDPAEAGTVITADLCGGTHVSRTGEVGLFRIVSESSVSAGVRRIEAVTAGTAYRLAKDEQMLLGELRQVLKAKPEDLVERVKALQQAGKGAVKKAETLDTEGLMAQVESLNGLQVLMHEVTLTDAATAGDVLREAVTRLKGQMDNGVVLLGTQLDGKATLVAGVGSAALGKVQAGAVVNAAAGVLGGRGGGKPDLAMAGGKAGDMAAALAAGRAVVA